MAKLEGEDFFQKLQQSGEHGITPASESKGLNLLDIERAGSPAALPGHEFAHAVPPVGGNEWTSYVDVPAADNAPKAALLGRGVPDVSAAASPASGYMISQESAPMRAMSGMASDHGGNEWTTYLDEKGAPRTFTNPDLLKSLDEVGIKGEGALAAVPKAFDIHSAIGHFEATDVIAAHRELTNIAGTVAEAGDTNPEVTRALSGLRDVMRPSAVTYDDLASAAWQATTQGKMMELGRVLAADGWEAEAETVLKLMPK